MIHRLFPIAIVRMESAFTTMVFMLVRGLRSNRTPDENQRRDHCDDRRCGEEGAGVLPFASSSRLIEGRFTVAANVRRLVQFRAGLKVARKFLWTVSVGAALAGTPALAQSNGDGFLFRKPLGLVTIRTGIDGPRAGSDIFSSFTKDLTVNRRDFRAFNIAGDVAFHERHALLR